MMTLKINNNVVTCHHDNPHDINDGVRLIIPGSAYGLNSY